MVPRVAEVVDVVENSADLVHGPGQPDLALVPLGGAEWGGRAGPRWAVADPVDLESVQVVVLLPHRHLDDVVQLREGEPARHVQPPPDRRVEVLQGHPQLIDDRAERRRMHHGAGWRHTGGRERP